MKNKKKWASLLTIATSLVLCIISTFGITLAFFGGNASANLSTITLKTGIEIGAAIESSVGSAKVVPGQPVKITATGTVSATTKGSANATNAVDGVVRAKFNVGNQLGEVTIAGNTTDFWTAGNDGYYYLVTTANGTTLRTVSKGTSVQIFGDLTVSKNFTNADSGKSVEASVIFEVVQADIYKADGSKVDLTIANATTSTNPLYSAFDAVKMEVDDRYTVTLTIGYAEGSAKDLGFGNFYLYIYADEQTSGDAEFQVEGVRYSLSNSDDGEVYVFKTNTFELEPMSMGLGGGSNTDSIILYTEKGGEKLFEFDTDVIWGSPDAFSTQLTSNVSYYLEFNVTSGGLD